MTAKNPGRPPHSDVGHNTHVESEATDVDGPSPDSRHHHDTKSHHDTHPRAHGGIGAYLARSPSRLFLQAHLLWISFATGLLDAMINLAPVEGKILF